MHFNFQWSVRSLVLACLFAAFEWSLPVPQSLAVSWRARTHTHCHQHTSTIAHANKDTKVHTREVEITSIISIDIRGAVFPLLYHQQRPPPGPATCLPSTRQGRR